MKMTVAVTGTTSLVDVLLSVGVEVTNVGEREIGGRCPVHIARTGKADGQPIRAGPRHRFNTNQPTTARAVFHNHRLTQPLTHDF